MSVSFKKIKKILCAVLLVALIAVATASVAAIFLKKDKSKPNFLFNRAFLWVETESMQPVIQAKSFISVRKYDSAENVDGEIIVFVCKDKSSAVYGKLVTHRVVEITEAGFKTKGDNPLSRVDPWTVKREDVVAVFVRTEKALTFIGRAFASPFGLAVIFALFLGSCAFVYIPEMLAALKDEDAEKKNKEKLIAERVEAEVERMIKENEEGKR